MVIAKHLFLVGKTRKLRKRKGNREGRGEDMEGTCSKFSEVIRIDAFACRHLQQF